MAFSPGTFAKQPYLPEPWSSSDNQTLDELLSQTDWKRKFGLPLPRFLLDYENLTAEIPDNLQSNHVRSSVATRWDSGGDLVEDSAGTLRLQRDPATQKVLGLLYEPKRTQLVDAPTDPTNNTFWDGNQKVDFGSTFFQRGLTGTPVQESNDTSSNQHKLISSNIALGTDEPIAESYIVEASNRPEVRLIALDSASNAVDVWFDISAGTIGTETFNGTTKITAELDDLGGGLYRIKASALPAAGESFQQIELQIGKAGEDNFYEGDGREAVVFYHAQVEVSREVTSPILSGGAVREADEVNYALSYPDKSTGVAYSIKQEAGGSYKDVGYTLLGTGGTSEKNHGALMDGGGVNDLGSDGWKTITRNSDDTDDAGDSPADETIDRFQVRYPTPADVQAPVRIVRQIVIWTQTLTSTQLSDLDSKYLTKP